MIHQIDLNKITEQEIEKLFKGDRLQKLYYTVVEFSWKQIQSYDMVKRLKDFDVAVNYGNAVGYVYVTDKKNNTKYEFKY